MKNLNCLVLLVLFSISISAQYTYVNTYNGTAVPVKAYAEGSSSWIQSTTQEYRDMIDNNNWSAEVIGNASRRYNCHYYAFQVTEKGGSSRAWMVEDPNSSGKGAVRLYLDSQHGGDGSFKELPYSERHFADKVFYDFNSVINNGGSGHSADYNPDPQGRGWDWVSKWAEYPLVRHALVNHIYAGSNTPLQSIKYFAQCSGVIDWGDPKILGPEIICAGDIGTFVLNNHIGNSRIAQITTSNDSYFDYKSVTLSNGTIRLRPKAGVYGTCTITYKLIKGCNKSKTFSKTITVGGAPVDNATVHGPSDICPFQPFMLWLSGVDYNNVDIHWNPYNAHVVWQSGYRAEVEQFYSSLYCVVTLTNACDVSQQYTISRPQRSNCGSWYFKEAGNIENEEGVSVKELILYPNPAKDFVYIQNVNALESPVVKIMTISGAVALDNVEVGFDGQVDISTLKPGLYIVHCQTNTMKISDVFVKE